LHNKEVRKYKIQISLMFTQSRCSHIYLCSAKFSRHSSHFNGNVCDQKFCIGVKKNSFADFSQVQFAHANAPHWPTKSCLIGNRLLCAMLCFTVYWKCNFSYSFLLQFCFCDHTLKVFDVSYVEATQFEITPAVTMILHVNQRCVLLITDVCSSITRAILLWE